MQGFGFGSAAHAVAVFIDLVSGALHFVTIAGGDEGALVSSVRRVSKVSVGFVGSVASIVVSITPSECTK